MAASHAEEAVVMPIDLARSFQVVEATIECPDEIG